MNPVMIEKMDLPNGLVLELFDCSRPLAGDRYLVAFEARLEIDVTPERLSDLSSMDIDLVSIQAVLGDRVEYIYHKERNFIDEKDKDALFEEMKNKFLDSDLKYMSREEFPGRLIMRKYQQTKTYTPQWLKI